MKKHFLNTLVAISFLVGGTAIFMQSCSNDESTLNALSSNEVQLRSANASDNGAKYVPNEVIVKFKAGASATARENALNHVNAQVAEKILTHAMKHAGDNDGIVLIKVPMAALDAITRRELQSELKDIFAVQDEIARKIENEMTYPGQIKVTVIREVRSVEYAR